MPDPLAQTGSTARMESTEPQERLVLRERLGPRVLKDRLVRRVLRELREPRIPMSTTRVPRDLRALQGHLAAPAFRAIRELKAPSELPEQRASRAPIRAWTALQAHPAPMA